MRSRHLDFAATAALVAMAAAFVVGRAIADETRTMPTPQKAIAQPFLDGLVGSWTTASDSIHDGKQAKGTGRTTYARGVGGTALLQDYSSTAQGPDGKPMNYHGHGVTKLSEDGKSVTIWWFCNMSPDVLRLNGPVTDKGYELSGEMPQGGNVTLSMQKTADGYEFKLKEGSNEMTETYTRAK